MRKPKYLILSLVFTAIALLSLYGLCWSATYYVDATLGSDASADPTNIATPWQTIAKVNSTLTGDQSDTNVLFKKGETWREQLTVPGSGTSGHPFTFGAYGTGANPVINGSNIITGSTWSGTSYDFYDNFNDNDITDWDTVEAGVVAANQRVEVSITAAATYRAYTNLGTTYTEIQAQWKFTLVSGYANFDNNDFIRGSGLRRASGLKYICFGVSDDVGTKKWYYYYDTDTGTVTGEAATGPSDNTQYTMKVYFKAATGAGANDGIIRYYVNDDVIYEATNLDNDTISFDQALVGSGYASAMTATIYIDDYCINPTDLPENVWQTALATESKQIFFDNALGTLVANVAAVDGDKEFFWEGGLLTLYSVGNPNTTYTTIEAGARDYSITATDKSYVTVDSFDLRNANLDNLSFVNSAAAQAGIVIANSSMTNPYRKGINIKGTSGYYFTGVDISSNSVSGGNGGGVGGGNAASAITIYYADAVTIHGNALSMPGAASTNYEAHIYWHFSSSSDTGSSIYNNTLTGTAIGLYCSGVKLGSVSYTSVHHNTITANIKELIHFDETASDSNDGPDHCSIYSNRLIGGALTLLGIFLERSQNNTVSYNIIDMRNTPSGGQAIDCCRNSRVSLVYNNVILVQNDTEAIRFGSVLDDVGDDQRDSKAKNNIIYHTGSTGTTVIAVFDGNGGSPVTTGIEFDYNLYYDADATNIAGWFGTWYDSIAAFAAGVAGQEANYKSGDPLFVNAAGGDFRLQSGSPAINAGVGVGLVTDYSGFPVGATPEIGAFESGNAPRFNSGGTGGGVMQ